MTTDLLRIARIASRPGRPQRVLGRIVIASLFAFGVFSLTHLGLSTALLDRAVDNIQRVFSRLTFDHAQPMFVAENGALHVFALSFPSAGDLAHLLGLTLGVVILGTVIAALVSIPVSYISASNTSPTRWLRVTGRTIGIVTRAVPDVVIAIAVSLFFAIGATLPGVIAIGIHSVGMISKLMTDAVEEIDEGPRWALRATGASKAQEFWSGVFPQVLPSWIATTLHRFDINLRGSVILGYAGVGGLGYRMRNEFERFQFGAGLGIALIIFVMCVVVEIVSSAIRRNLLGAHSTRSTRLTPVVPTMDASLRRPWNRTRLRNVGAIWVTAAVIGASAWLAHIDFTAVQWAQVGPSLASFFPPTFGSYPPAVFLEALLKTVEIAFAAATLTFPLALLLGSLAARNVAPSSRVRNTVRAILVIIRAVPELVLAIFLIAATGLGEEAGVVALAFGGVGLLGKLIADSLEQIPRGPETALAALGAGRGQRFMAATLPLGASALISNSLYLVDANIRAASILGIIGAGGVGYYLTMAAGSNSLHGEVTTIVIMLIVVLLIMEGIAAWLRSAPHNGD
jgi:phosphonate transport system permease protein